MATILASYEHVPPHFLLLHHNGTAAGEATYMRKYFALSRCHPLSISFSSLFLSFFSLSKGEREKKERIANTTKAVDGME